MDEMSKQIAANIGIAHTMVRVWRRRAQNRYATEGDLYSAALEGIWLGLQTPSDKLTISREAWLKCNADWAVLRYLERGGLCNRGTWRRIKEGKQDFVPVHDDIAIVSDVQDRALHLKQVLSRLPATDRDTFWRWIANKKIGTDNRSRQLRRSRLIRKVAAHA